MSCCCNCKCKQGHVFVPTSEVVFIKNAVDTHKIAAHITQITKITIPVSGVYRIEESNKLPEHKLLKAGDEIYGHFQRVELLTK